MANNTSQNNKYNFALSLFNQLNYEKNELVTSTPVISVPTVERFTCIVCYDEYVEDNIFSCKKNHKICIECMKQHMNMNLLDQEKENKGIDKEKILKREGLIICPDPNCIECYQPTDIVIKLRDAILIDKYYKTIHWVSHHKVTMNRIQKMLDDLYKKFNDKSMDRESRRLQMRQALPNARMCSKCNYGPITKVGCDNLQTHGHQFLNSCPRCGDHQTDFSKMKPWDGRLPEETEKKEDLVTLSEYKFSKIHDNLIIRINFPYQGWIFLDQHRQKLIPLGAIKCEKGNFIVCCVEFKGDNMIVYNNESTKRSTKEIGFLENESIVIVDNMYFTRERRSRHSGRFLISKKKGHVNLWTCCGCKDGNSIYCNMNTSSYQQKKNNSRHFIEKNKRIFDRPKRNFGSPQHKFNRQNLTKFFDFIKTKYSKFKFISNSKSSYDINFLKKNLCNFKSEIGFYIDKNKHLYFVRKYNRVQQGEKMLIFSSEGFEEVEIKSNQLVLEVMSSKDQFGDWKSSARNSKAFKINVTQDWDKFVKDAKEKLKHDIKCAHLITKRLISSSSESIKRYNYTAQALLDSKKYKMNFKYFSKNSIIVCHDNDKAVVDAEKDRKRRLEQDRIRQEERRRREEQARRRRQEEARRRREEERRIEMERKKREAVQKRKREEDRKKKQAEELKYWNDKRKKDLNSRKRSASLQRLDMGSDDFIDYIMNPNPEPIGELDEQILNSLFN